MKKNRLTLGYVLLVGAPLLVLLSASEMGKGLTPEPAIAGDWALEWDAAPVFQKAAIAQSGRDVVLTSGDRRWRGTLENSRLSVEGPEATAIHGVITGDRTHRLLQGQLVAAGQSHGFKAHLLAAKEGRN
jgi:hypothetical protein